MREPLVPPSSPLVSERVAVAQARSIERRELQRERLRPLGWAILALVAVPAATGRPAPGLSGMHLAVTLALAVYLVSLVLQLRSRLGARGCISTVVLLGSAGVALAALQPKGPVEIAPSVAVWLAAARLPQPISLPLAAAITLGFDLAIALTGLHWEYSAASGTVLCVLMAATARFMRRANESQDQTARLLAELEDARDSNAQAAALAERAHIARDLHDVLAHSLSALAIQIEGARVLATREPASKQLPEVIARAAELVKHGLAEAKQAVGALRGDSLPAIAELPGLLDGFRELGLDVTLEITGEARPLPQETSLALYRTAQEALTNAVRYAPGSHMTVTLHYANGCVSLAVEDHGSTERGASAALGNVGGGRGLAGMRERIESLGGYMSANPTSDGFRVEVEAPA